MPELEERQQLDEPMRRCFDSVFGSQISPLHPAQDQDVQRLKRIADGLRAMKPDMEALGGTQAEGLLTIPKRRSVIEDFITTVGDDIEICVQGDYERDDPGVGYRGGYSVTKVWLGTDMHATDIQSLLTKEQIDRIEEKGAECMAQQVREEAADAAEHYREVRSGR